MSKELTEAWKAGKLNHGWYFVKLANETYPDYYKGYFIQTGDKDGIEVLASCDYDELQQLKEEKDKWAYQCGKSDAEKWEYQRNNTHLRNLLKECKEYLSDVEEYRIKNADEAYLLLTHINAAIGESEER